MNATITNNHPCYSNGLLHSYIAVEMAEKALPTKKLINSPSTTVEDSLSGLTLVYPSLQLLRSPHKVVVRSDVDDVIARGSVTLVCGGGSGTRARTRGVRWQGDADRCCPGGCFRVAAFGSDLTAFRAVANPAGTLAIVTNYTGDKLNFGIAVEKARSEGMKVEMVVVGDDCALPSVSRRLDGGVSVGRYWFIRSQGPWQRRGVTCTRFQFASLIAGLTMDTEPELYLVRC